MSIRMNNNNRNKGATTLFCHDADFKTLITVPLSAVHHAPAPAAQREISRLVKCRTYDPREPATSCSEGNNCRFVHLDMSHPRVEVQTIHVNYAYRSLEEVPHQRLPAGDMLSIMAPNNRAPIQLIPSELVLNTIGVHQLENSTAPLSHCAHFYFNRCCDRGERCHFVHTLCIDETAEPGQRAPARAGVSRKAIVPVGAAAAAPVVVAPAAAPQSPVLAQAPSPVVSKQRQQSGPYSPVAPPSFGAISGPPSYMVHSSSSSSHRLTHEGSNSSSSSSNAEGNCGHSESPRSGATASTVVDSAKKVFSPGIYRHNPYSVVHTITTGPVAMAM